MSTALTFLRITALMSGPTFLVLVIYFLCQRRPS